MQFGTFITLQSAIFFLLDLIILSNILINRNQIRTHKVFGLFAFSTTLLQLVSTIALASESIIRAGTFLQYIIYAVIMAAMSLASYGWFEYMLLAVQKEKQRVFSNRWFHFIPVVIITIAGIMSYWTHWIFFIDSNHAYQRGSLFFLQIACTYIYLLAALAAVIITCLKGNQKNTAYTIKYFTVFFVPALAGVFIQTGLNIRGGYIQIGMSIAMLLTYMNMHEECIKELQTGLAQSNERLGIIQSISDIYYAAYYIDMEHDTFTELSAKPKIRELIGVTGNAQAQLYVMCDKLIVPEFADMMREFVDFRTMNERLKEKKVITTEFQGINVGWSQAYFIAGDRDENGNLKHIFYATRIIHDEKEKEQEQNRIINSLSKDYYSAYHINLKDGSFRLIGIENNYTDYVSFTGDELAGSADFDVYFGKYMDSVIAPDELKEVKSVLNVAGMRELLKTREQIEATFHAVEDGRPHTYQYRIVKLKEDKNVPAEAILALRIIDEIIAKEKLHQQELEKRTRELAEYNEIISNAGLGIWFIKLKDGEPPRMKANDKMLEVLGIEDSSMSEEAIYTYWYDRIIESDVGSVQESVQKMIDGYFSENTYRWEHPAKGIVYVRCGGTAEKLADGHFVLSGYHADVTAIVLAEKEQKNALADALAVAEHANKAKTTFLNSMSHDIRTPMNAIVGFTALAARYLDDPEQVKVYLNKISTSSSHLLSLINDVLDMSRIESGKVKIDEKEVHLPDIFNDLRTIVQSDVAARNMELFIDTLDVKDEDVICDRLRLNQILLNLMSNALKYSQPGGTVSVRVIQKPGAPEGYADFEFRVKDSGIGMSQEFLQHIFEPFERERTATVSGIQGTGLGLAITKNIIDMMGGTITVTSEEGKGSEFTVNLRFRLSSKAVVYEQIEELKGVRALIADDDMDTCYSLSKMLEDIGMRPDWTTTGKEAVARTKFAVDRGDEYGVFIIDWLMPDLNGIETVRRIRKIIGNESPIIILTAYDWTDIESEAIEAGVTAFCSKPLFMSELRDVLSKPFKVQDDEDKSEADAVDFTGKKILLVEDNLLNQEIAVEILQEAGFVVETADDGDVAVNKLRYADSNQYDLVLMDVQMPRMDGYTATREIRTLPDHSIANIPIIAITANAFEEDKKKVIEAGMNGHIAKPIDIPTLMETLAVILK